MKNRLKVNRSRSKEMRQEMRAPWTRVVVGKGVKSVRFRVYFDANADRICQWFGGGVEEKGRGQG